MSDPGLAYSALRAKLETDFTAIPLRWENEIYILPDEPSAFAFVEFVIEGSAFAAFGGGKGSNLHRVTGRLDIHVLVPLGVGMPQALLHGESIAAVLRDWRDTVVSCTGAVVKPGGRDTEDGNYFRVLVEVSFTFLQTG